MLGEFPDQGEDTLISLSLLESAVKPRNGGTRPSSPSDAPHDEESQEHELVVMAVDVARFGSDKSVILKRRGMIVEEMQSHRGLDTMKLVGRVVDAIEAWHPEAVVVDEVGIGAGVVDRLRELGHRVQAVNVGRPARENDHFANLRAEGYWILRQLFMDGTVSIPPDNDLTGQLAALRYTFNSMGQVVMESKEEMRRRGVASPDKADALMMCFLPIGRKVRLWG